MCPADLCGSRAKEDCMDGVEPVQATSGIPLLATRALAKDFRGFRAVDGVDLIIAQGTIHALVGPNGAGKTTLFNLLTGFLAPTSGSITYLSLIHISEPTRPY